MAWEATGSLVSRLGRLTSGQVVTAVAPIAQALADAHGRGLVHGRLTAAEVHLTAEGKPVLDGFGLNGFGTPEDDVRALAHLGLDLLLPQSSGPVREALLAAEMGDARDLAAALLTACVAEPLRAAPDVARVVPTRRPRRWPTALAALLAAALTGAHLLRAHQPVSWAAVLEGLDAQRAEAFARGDAALLEGVYVPGSTARAEDAARLRALRARHQTAHGLRHQLSVVEVAADRDSVALEVIASLVTYEITEPDGAGWLVPAGQPIRQHVTLLRTRVGWRVGAVIT
jgi:hypothetical protein